MVWFDSRKETIHWNKLISIRKLFVAAALRGHTTIIYKIVFFILDTEENALIGKVNIWYIYKSNPDLSWPVLFFPTNTPRFLLIFINQHHFSFFFSRHTPIYWSEDQWWQLTPFSGIEGCLPLYLFFNHGRYPPSIKQRENDLIG